MVLFRAIHVDESRQHALAHAQLGHAHQVDLQHGRVVREIKSSQILQTSNHFVSKKHTGIELHNNVLDV